MSKITPLMTSLHEGHKAEERFKCIDDTLKHCEDTKYTVLQAFWWYRKYTKAKLQKLEQIEKIITETENQHYELQGKKVVMNSLAYDKIKGVIENG